MHSPARITIFAGHYGSGKTTLALSYALWLRRQFPAVTLADLDIVNPYFRTADASTPLQENGVVLISSAFAGSNVDAPALPAATRAIFDDKNRRAVIDLGGDDRGALALGRYAKPILAEDPPAEMLLVINQYRPLTRNLADLRQIKDEIEQASKVPFTGVVNNSNLGAATTLEDISKTAGYAREISQALALPLRFTAIFKALLPPPEQAEVLSAELGAPFFPVDIFEKSIWRI